MVLPKNDRRLVTLTINSLLAMGDEIIPLDATWRKAFAEQSKYRNKSVPDRLPLWEVLERAQVSRAFIKAFERDTLSKGRRLCMPVTYKSWLRLHYNRKDPACFLVSSLAGKSQAKTRVILSR
jgi:hypothetical protein